MSHRKSLSAGFTLIELVITITLVGIITTTLFTFSNTSINQYLALQQDGIVFGDLAMQSHRIAQVLRGLTDITQATDTEITAYAYFSPNDAYVSLIHYYKNIAGTAMIAEVTPLDANPPIGTLQTTKKRTFTIISSFYSDPAVKTFVYLDSSGNTLTTPIADLHTIKGITINLAVPSKSPTANGNDAISVQVSLRNRKTNL